MMNKYGYYRYSDISLGAKEKAKFSTNIELQSGSTLTDLSVGVNPHNYASFEHNGYNTNSTLKLYKENSQKLGFVSKIISDEDGNFENSVILEIKFTDTVTMTGITIYSGNTIENLKISAYDGNNEIISREMNYSEKTDFFEIPIENANKIIIEISKIKEPLSFLKLYEIVFGTIRLLEDITIDANLKKNFSILGDTLSYDTLDITILEEKIDLIAQQNQIIEHVYNGTVDTTLFINKSISNDETLQLSAYDGIASLEGDFLGGYNFLTFGNLLNKILKGTNIPFTVDEDVANIGIGGYLPIMTKRKALQLLLLGTGVRCYKNSKLEFKKIEKEPQTLILNESNILKNPKIEKKEMLKSFKVVFQEYASDISSPLLEVYRGLLSPESETHFITFSNPIDVAIVYDVDDAGNAENVNRTIEIIEIGINYCVLKGQADNEIAILGIPIKPQYKKEYEKKSPKTNNAFREINIELPIMKSGGINEIGDELYKIYARGKNIVFQTFEKLEIGKCYNILGENLNVVKIEDNGNGLYEVEAE